MADNGVYNLCNMIHTYTDQHSDIRQAINEVDWKKNYVDVWKVLSSKLASPEKREKANYMITQWLSPTDAIGKMSLERISRRL